MSSAAVVICALRVYSYIGPIIGLGKSLLKNHTGPLNVSLKLVYLYTGPLKHVKDGFMLSVSCSSAMLNFK